MDERTTSGDGKTVNEEEWKTCPVCRFPVKSKNYANHLHRVHGVVDQVEKSAGIETKVGRRKIGLALTAIVLIVAGLGGYFAFSTGGESYIPANPNLPANQTEARIPIAQISDRASFYTYNSGGVNIRYFAVKGNDGQIHVAFDACDVCYPAKKGYRQIGDVMHCNNCGREFPINSIGTQNLAGGCWPSYLPMSIDENEVVIKISDIEGKKYMFE